MITESTNDEVAWNVFESRIPEIRSYDEKFISFLSSQFNTETEKCLQFLKSLFNWVERRRKSYGPNNSRVDVSATSSIDQLWFRDVSLLIQCCSLTKNLWTALIQQRWKRKFSDQKTDVEQCWFRVYSFLTSTVHRWSTMIFSVLKCADSKKITADQLWNSADERWCSSCSLNQLWKICNLWRSAVQRWLSLEVQLGVTLTISGDKLKMRGNPGVMVPLKANFLL